MGGGAEVESGGIEGANRQLFKVLACVCVLCTRAFSRRLGKNVRRVAMRVVRMDFDIIAGGAWAYDHFICITDRES